MQNTGATMIKQAHVLEDRGDEKGAHALLLEAEKVLRESLGIFNRLGSALTVDVFGERATLADLLVSLVRCGLRRDNLRGQLMVHVWMCMHGMDLCFEAIHACDCFVD